MRHAVLRILLPSVFFLWVLLGTAENGRAAQPAWEEAEELDSGSLYAQSAVLMDGDTGRVLFEKNGETPRPNASTTKVLTCILALEKGAGDDYVPVSEKAAAQPDVQLGLRKGEQYYLEDLLYSLMLMSHNDTAVAIAEHIGGSTEGFAKMMNDKAREIGCTDTYFITPNGLDAEDKNGIHHTTAEDLARIMRYALESETFLKITETKEYSFSDLSGKRCFSLHNTNALLTMTEGVLSGKTGFTGKAGYCYVCACKKEGKTFVIALLGCGWPSHKDYKWKDTLKLLDYGNRNYAYQDWWKDPVLPELEVKNEAAAGLFGKNPPRVKAVLSVPEEEKHRQLLLKQGEQVNIQLKLMKELAAPLKKGDRIGTCVCTLNGEKIADYPVLADREIQEITYRWCVDQVFHGFFH